MSLSTLSFEAWARVLHFTDYWHHARLASTGDKQVLRALTHVERGFDLTSGPLDRYYPSYSSLVTALLAGKAKTMKCTGKQLGQFVGPFPGLERLVLARPIVVVVTDPLNLSMDDGNIALGLTLDVAVLAPNLKFLKLDADVTSYALKLPITLQSLEITDELTQTTCKSLMSHLQHLPDLTSLKFVCTRRKRMFSRDVDFPPRLTSLQLTVRSDEEWLIPCLPQSLTNLRVHVGSLIRTSDLSHLTCLVDLTVTNDFSTRPRGCCLRDIPSSITKICLGTACAGSEEELVENFRTLPPSVKSLSFTSMYPQPTNGNVLIDMIDALAPRVNDEDIRRILIAVSDFDVASQDAVKSTIEGALVRRGEDAPYCMHVLDCEARMRRAVTFSTRRSVYGALVERNVPQPTIVSLFNRNPWDDACWGSVMEDFFLDDKSRAQFIGAAELTRISRLTFMQTGCALPSSVAFNLTHVDMLIDESSDGLEKLLLTKLERLQQLTITFDPVPFVRADPSDCWRRAVNIICKSHENMPHIHALSFVWGTRKNCALAAELQEALAQIRLYPVFGGMQFRFRVQKPHVLPILDAK